MKKLIFALIVIAALVVVAMPVAAQGPDPYIPVRAWYNRTSQMSATWAGDPFGGNPRLNIAVKYDPDGKGGVQSTYQSKSYVDYAGIVGKFGPSPWAFQDALPGGIPSSMSGDGSAPRKAIYIGGAWADPSVDPASATVAGKYMGSQLLPTRGGNEDPIELPACATTKITAGGSKWYKLDTWFRVRRGTVNGTGSADDYQKVQTQIWVDDELDGATQPSGSAVFGAANRYNWGTQDNDGWTVNYSGNRGDMNPEDIQGFFMAVYGPDVLQPNYAFSPPNAWLFTLNVSGSGSLSRTCTAAAYAGENCITGATAGGYSAPAGVSASTPHTNITSESYYLGNPQAATAANAVTVYGNFNPRQPNHLLWVEGTWDGWVFVRVINQMIWDGTATVCSYRHPTAQPAGN